MRTDEEIYNTISNILLYIAPNDSKTVLLKVQLSPKDDVCRFKYYSVNIFGDKNWFIQESGRISSDIRKQIVMLRTFYIENNLNNDQQIWNTAHMSLDLTTGKFDIEFEFDEIFEHEGEEFLE